MELVISIFLILMAVYLGLGALFYFPFIMKGIFVIDDDTRDSSLGFKLLIIPGVVAFWPFLLRKWVSGKTSES